MSEPELKRSNTVEVDARPHDPSKPSMAAINVEVVGEPSLLVRMASKGLELASAARSLPAQLSAKALLGLPLEYEAAAFEESPTQAELESLSSPAAAQKRGVGLLRAAINATRFIKRMVKSEEETEEEPSSAFEPTGEVKALLDQHAAALQAMADGLASDPLFKLEVHDALWRLRFLLSAKNKADKATKDAAACLKWRVENNIEDIAAKVRSTPWEQWPGFRQVQQFTPDHVTHPDRSRGTVVFKRITENDFDGLFGGSEPLKDEDWILYQFYLKEWLFQRRDATSRRTGSLAKNTVVVDMGGLSRKHMGNKRYKALMTHPAIKKADEMYPQALGTIVLVNLPGALSFLFNTVVKPLAPAKVQEKIRVASNPASEFEKIGLPASDVPSVLGGQMAAWPPAPDARTSPP